jgi:hypothetical protein
VLRGYAGTGEVFADAITSFAKAYAGQVEADYEQVTREVQQRGVRVERGL